MQFPAIYTDIIAKINSIDPQAYGRTRNFIDGAVTYLSPYISRGVISVKLVAETLMKNGYQWHQMEKFLQELAWREYFQRCWQSLEDDLFDDIRRRSTGTQHRQLPAAIASASTGIESIDAAIRTLDQTGYMHNHLRMYVASITCNIGKAYWQMPSQWMYYHLLDGDIASNICSWQWVAGNFSSKQYYCNQENINKYTYSNQQQTFLDKSYDELPRMQVPPVLQSLMQFTETTILPQKQEIMIDPSLPVLLYNSYNLDPLWRKEEKANRILLLEPSHFRQFPVSEKVINFILSLAQNIQGIQVYVGEVNELQQLIPHKHIFSKEHPAFVHYPGVKDERDWLFPDVTGHYNSFFGYWKKCASSLRKNYPAANLLIRA